MSRDSLSDRDLARLLDEQIDAMQAVMLSLEAERQALTRRDADALLKAVNDKAASIASADSIENRRQATLQRLGISLGLADRPGRPGRGLSADAGISQRWQQVMALTQQCRALNEANGQMIRGQRRRVEGTLQVIRGGEPAVPAEYGPGGEHRARASQRLLGSY